MNQEDRIATKDLITESLLRDLILFSFLYFILLAQNWTEILLILFPLITFCFALFFKILDILKLTQDNEVLKIFYNPLGSEKIISNRLNFCAILQSALLIWFGGESLYHPQLVNDYYLYFIFLLIFLYTFGFYWIIADVWKYASIKINLDQKDFMNDSIINDAVENIISFLKMKSFKIIFFINLLVFIILNLLNIIFSYLIINKLMLGIPYNLPGTGIEKSNPIMLSSLIYIIMALSPSLSIGFFIVNFKIINDIDQKRFDDIVMKLPENIKKLVFNNLSTLNSNLKNRLRLE